MDSINTRSWQWNEFQQVGMDYADIEQVRAYDERMGKMRDFDAENRQALEALQLNSKDAVLEIGTGTGALAIAAAKVCRKVTAYDVSEAMLAYAREKALNCGAANIEFKRGGFLTIEKPDESQDAVMTQLALHHLPDFWKMVALRNIHRLLRPGGKLWLMDVVFSFNLDDYQQFFDNILDIVHPDMRPGFESHIRQEFSTVTWVMEGIIERAGFEIVKKEYEAGFIGRYLCRRV